MPSVVIRGDPVWLNCSFDLESDDLYSVKWYKNHREFFRYLPSESPPAQSYRLSGVYVDSGTRCTGSTTHRCIFHGELSSSFIRITCRRIKGSRRLLEDGGSPALALSRSAVSEVDA
ncbi:hypothetical protein HPB47_019643 [Ixodes persulcatus]|uniref:Uncharacterized protein n=1 Tax=Ixodes persulcatus TaxID=34615 RepID=A0AC60QL73_IXOPE|nr:hypothetical protein HPB47_019643 [Ixodes persulcatus]